MGAFRVSRPSVLLRLSFSTPPLFNRPRRNGRTQKTERVAHDFSEEQSPFSEEQGGEKNSNKQGIAGSRTQIIGLFRSKLYLSEVLLAGS